MGCIGFCPVTFVRLVPAWAPESQLSFYNYNSKSLIFMIVKRPHWRSKICLSLEIDWNHSPERSVNCPHLSLRLLTLTPNDCSSNVNIVNYFTAYTSTQEQGKIILWSAQSAVWCHKQKKLRLLVDLEKVLLFITGSSYVRKKIRHLTWLGYWQGCECHKEQSDFSVTEGNL